MKKTLQLLFASGLCALILTSASAQTQVRVPGFQPSTSGFHFTNSFPSVPYTTINVGGIQVPIGDASNGMCGGMAHAARDYHEAGIPVPPDLTAPSSGPLFNYLSKRLFDSFSLPAGPLRYVHLMDP
ncbi:MAG TPA: hypothetical protein VJS64_08695, partial [Pyrinomonadaceae bacterium]|nr:hypothetical protein [Pyrinomonadaceae bacterium]